MIFPKRGGGMNPALRLIRDGSDTNVAPTQYRRDTDVIPTLISWA